MSNQRQNFVTHGRHQLQVLTTAPTGPDTRNSNFGTMDMLNQQKLLYMFERLNVPLYMGPRGTDNNYFSVPTDGMTEKQKIIMNDMKEDMGPSVDSQNFVINKPRQKIDIRAIGMACPRQAHFSFFIPAHREAVSQLADILMKQPDIDQFINAAAFCRDSAMINSQLWLHAVASSALKRKDMRGVKLPALWEVMPDLVIPSSAKKLAEQQAQLPMKSRSIILINGPSPMQEKEGDQKFIDITTGRNENPENKLAYFREDLGIASHHWHWHIIYAGNSAQGMRDRRGELFYYMHHAMCTRYDAERLSHGLPRVRPLDVSAGPVLAEGYFSKLSAQNSGDNWGTRQEKTLLKSVSRTDGNIDFRVNIEDMRKWKDRLSDAIDTGVILTSKGGRKNLRAEMAPSGPEVELDTGVDILGNLLESAESYSENMQFYGNLHNMGHVVIGFSHDPEKRHNEKIGPMGSEATALRDPAFFRWHKFVDDMFDKWKQTLPPYREEQLVWKGIRVSNIEVQTPKLEKNHLRTNLRWTDIDLSRGLDLARSQKTMGPVWARISHLDHLPFDYKISVFNDLPTPVRATVRIFMAPRHNEQGERFTMSHQRNLFIEMDKFFYTLNTGLTQITRRSSDSSVTIPWEQSFRDLEKVFSAFSQGKGDPSAREAICGCGWPQHLLLPRGSHTGMIFDLFVMVTGDALKDRQSQSSQGGKPCKESVSFCGILDTKYPDVKPMGFPFDRPPRMITKPGSTMPVMVANLNEFIPIQESNMRTTQITITHSEKDIQVREDSVNGAPGGMEVIMSLDAQEQMAMEGRDGTTMMNEPRRPGQGISSQEWRRAGRSSDEDDDDTY